MKLTFSLFSISLLLCNLSYSQEFHPTNFTGTISPPASGVTSCATLPAVLPTTTPDAITFDVSGVGVLNTTSNTLYRIDLDFAVSFGCGSYNAGQKPNQDDDLQLILVAPNGTCAVIYNADWATTTGGTPGNFSYPFSHNQIVGLSSVGCNLQSPTGKLIRTDQVNYNPDVTSNFGIFASVTNLITTFDGVNANGTWTILLDNTSTNRPFCISNTNTKLTFATNILQDETTNGGQCVDAVDWHGEPTCVSTAGKPTSSNLPGWNGGANGNSANFKNFNGTNCLWNGDNNNSIWISFTPTTAEEICISLSGVSAGKAQQSVIVTDSDNDGDGDPCTGTNGTYWDIVSCPDGPVYSGTSGTVNNANHCFIPTPNQTYYLVIDGAGGAESEVYIHASNMGAIALPIELASFTSNCEDNKTTLDWVTASEVNCSHFDIQKSMDAIYWNTIETIAGQGNSTVSTHYSFQDNESNYGINYYRLKQVDYDGTNHFSEPVYSECEAPFTIILYPNPIGTETLTIVFNEFCRSTEVFIYSMDGKTVYYESIEDMIGNTISIDMNELFASGMYYVKAVCGSHVDEAKLVVK